MSKLLELYSRNLLIKNSIARASTTDLDENGVATFYLYDAIDDWYGVSAKEVANFILDMENKATSIKLRMNSPGGDVFEARTMASIVKGCKIPVDAVIDGLCASAATYVATSCRSVSMHKGSFFMVHKAWARVAGNSDELVAMASLLNKVDDSIVESFVEKTKNGADDLKAMLAAETWMNHAEALEHGFIDSIIDVDTQKNNLWDLSVYDKTPEQLKKSVETVENTLYKRERYDMMARLFKK